MADEERLPIKASPIEIGKVESPRYFLNLQLFLPLLSLGVAAFVVPYAWAASGMKPNVVFACILWLTVWACIFPTLARLPALKKCSRRVRILTAITVPLIFSICFSKPIKAKYEEQHAPDKQQTIENFVKGGDFPNIEIELYWGPTNGMKHTVTLAEKESPLCVVNYQNTNAFPIYDVSVSMFRSSAPNLIDDFNKGEKEVPILKSTEPRSVFCQIRQTNHVSMSFAVTTRASFSVHNFNFLLLTNRWVHSNNVVGSNQRKISESVTKGFF